MVKTMILSTDLEAKSVSLNELIAAESKAKQSEEKQTTKLTGQSLQYKLCGGNGMSYPTNTKAATSDQK